MNKIWFWISFPFNLYQSSKHIIWSLDEKLKRNMQENQEYFSFGDEENRLLTWELSKNVIVLWFTECQNQY